MESSRLPEQLITGYIKNMEEFDWEEESWRWKEISKSSYKWIHLTRDGKQKEEDLYIPEM